MEDIENNRTLVNQDMDHIKQALQALDKNLSNKKYIGASNALTVVDIVVYNELS